MKGPLSARRRLAAFAPQAAVVYGSGLAALPAAATLVDELGFRELGWPCGGVPGHAYRLLLVRMTVGVGDAWRLALACGRPHRYEGWSDAELEAPVRDLCAAGAGSLLLTNSCGALRDHVRAGDVIVCTEVMDLQSPPRGDEPERLAVCSPDESDAVVRALDGVVRARTGSYVAVTGPQYETPAEVRWLATLGDVVGMSAAAEIRAAHGAGAGCCLLAVVVNAAGAVGSHDEVLDAGDRLAQTLAAGVGAVLAARWPSPV